MPQDGQTGMVKVSPFAAEDESLRCDSVTGVLSKLTGCRLKLRLPENHDHI